MAGKRCRFDPKKLFQKILKKGLTKRGFCYILNKSSAMSHQKRQQLNKMESWLSGRRRTTGNRVTVMSGSRVQIPDSPPVRTPEIITISGVFLSSQHDRSAESGISTIILKKTGLRHIFRGLDGL